MAEVSVEKSNNAFKYIMIFCVFLIIGVVVGFFGTKKYMDSKKDLGNNETIVEGPEDITNFDEYQELIQKLHSFVDGYSIFYTTKGVELAKMGNDVRLSYIFDYLEKNAKVESDSLVASYGSNNCINEFSIDDTSNLYSNSNVCSVKKVDRNLISTTNKTLFNDELVDTSVGFVNSEGKKCIVSEDNYLCGTPVDGTNNSGKLESKFTITKVTKDEGTIVIYDKGYLLDNRSSIVNPDDGHDKYYLHSSDSNNYYYELKNADNLTFKHTFVSTDRVNYYYVSSELVKE